MTVTYSLDVAKARFCGFGKLLGRWKGSIYKILWKEFALFCLGYAVLSATYRYCLNPHQKEVFEKVVLFVETIIDFIPLSFVLGFYVSLVVGRWWSQYESIPWPDSICFMIASHVHGSDERSRMIRRTLARYLILTQALTFQAVSTAVKRRFPSTQHLVEAGIMTKEERSLYEKVKFGYGKYWLPCHWFCALATRARKEGRIKDSILLDALFRGVLNFKTSCAIMIAYDAISVPLVYTQVVTLATYMYSVALMVGKQYLDPSKGFSQHQVDMYVPVFTLVQFFFYVGWLKVAEQIVNPYGEDDDDFELNWCLDRTVHIVYLVVDDLQMKHPKVSRDYFWDDTEPKLPQTKHSAKSSPQLGSAFYLNVGETEYLSMDGILEQDTEENIYSGDSVKKKAERLGSSLVRRVFKAGFGQSFRQRSTFKGSSTKSTPRSQCYSNPAFAADTDNEELSNRGAAAASGKPRLKSIVRKDNSTHNRTSSLAIRKRSTKPHNPKVYGRQKSENLHFPKCSLSETERTCASGSVPATRTISAPVTSFEELNSRAKEKETLSEMDEGVQILGSSMTTIPEEVSRTPANVSAREVVSFESSSSQIGDVQNLVREANKVLTELTRTVSRQGHNHDSSLKGYESCCSTSSSDSLSDDSNRDSNGTNAEEQNSEITVVIEGGTSNAEKPRKSDFSQVSDDRETNSGCKLQFGLEPTDSVA